MVERRETHHSPEFKNHPCVDVIIVHGSGLHNSYIGKSGWLEEEYEEIRQKLKERERPLPLRQSKILHWLVDYGMGLYCLPKSSWDARIRSTAAGELWQRYHQKGKEVKIIVAGGNNYPSLAPSIAETMREDLMRRFKIPGQAIILADQGGNTISDMEQVVRIMKEKGFRTAINISSGFHRVAKKLAEKRGMTFVSAEELLEERDRRYQRIIADLYGSPAVKSLIEAQEKSVFLINIPLIGEKIYDWQARRSLPRRAEVTQFDSRGLQKMTGKLK